MALNACSGGSTVVPAATQTVRGDELTAPVSCADQAIAPGSMASAVVVIGVTDTLTMMAGCSAQLAYKQGAAVVLDGRSDASLLNILNLDSTVLNVSAGSASQQIANIVGTPETAPASPGDPMTPVTIKAVALKALPNGEVAAFHSFDVDIPTANTNAKLWAAGVVGDPSIGAWVPQFSNLVIVPPADDIQDQGVKYKDGTYTHSAVFYRLAEFNPTYDWYMATTQISSVPNYVRCNLPTIGKGSVGWYNDIRGVQIYDTVPTAARQLVDEGPSSTSGTNTTSFTLGGQVSGSASGPQGQVSATYSQTYGIADVQVINNSSTPSRGSWQLNFTGPQSAAGSSGCPPGTATSTYQSAHASMWQVPEGGSFVAESDAQQYWGYAFSNDWIFGKSYITQRAVTSSKMSYTFSQPVFNLSSSQISIDHTPGSTTTFTITASVPGAQQQLNWAITNIPSWLVVNQLTGVGTTKITLTTQGGAAPQSTAQLNIQTVPPGGANSVEVAPLIATVKSQ